MDEVDQANFIVERDETLAIKAAQDYKGPRATGYCLSPDCQLEIGLSKRFCDADCRDAYDKSRRIYGGK